jgi:hypothetical protein
MQRVTLGLLKAWYTPWDWHCSGLTCIIWFDIICDKSSNHDETGQCMQNSSAG